MFVLLSSGEGDSVGSTAVLCGVALWRKTAGKISHGQTRSGSGLSGLTPSSEMCVGWILSEQDCTLGVVLDHGAALGVGLLLVKMGLCSSMLSPFLNPAGDGEFLLFLVV